MSATYEVLVNLPPETWPALAFAYLVVFAASSLIASALDGASTSSKRGSDE